MKYRTQLIDLVVFFNCSDFGEATELRLGGNFLSQVSYSGVETKDTNSQFKILKLGRRFGSAPPIRGCKPKWAQIFFALESHENWGSYGV
jgi:hypothetical protein